MVDIFRHLVGGESDAVYADLVVRIDSVAQARRLRRRRAHRLAIRTDVDRRLAAVGHLVEEAGRIFVAENVAWSRRIFRSVEVFAVGHQVSSLSTIAAKQLIKRFRFGRAPGQLGALGRRQMVASPLILTVLCRVAMLHAPHAHGRPLPEALWTTLGVHTTWPAALYTSTNIRRKSYRKY